MQQVFMLFLSPKSGRISVRPVSAKGQFCQAFFHFKDEQEARQFLASSRAVKIRGGASINGTYTMEIAQREQEV